MINVSISREDFIRGLLELNNSEIIDVIKEIDHQVDNYEFTKELCKYFKYDSCVCEKESSMNNYNPARVIQSLKPSKCCCETDKSQDEVDGLHLSKKECEKFHRVLTRLIDGVESDEIFHFDIDYAKELLDKLESGIKG